MEFIRIIPSQNPFLQSYCKVPIKGQPSTLCLVSCFNGVLNRLNFVYMPTVRYGTSTFYFKFLFFFINTFFVQQILLIVKQLIL